MSAESKACVGASRRSPDRYLDIRDRNAVEFALDEIRPSVVVHLAGVSGPRADNEELARAVNAEGTANLVHAAMETGVSRVVFASTAAVYGTSRQHPVRETDPLDMKSTYARSKREAELRLASLGESPGTDVFILRIFNIWGAGFPDSLIERILRASRAEPVTLSGLDGFVRDYVHVDDVVQALSSATQSSRVTGINTLNIGSGIPTSNRTLLEVLRPEDGVFRLGDEVESYSCANIAHARAILDFAPSRVPGQLRYHSTGP